MPFKPFSLIARTAIAFSAAILAACGGGSSSTGASGGSGATPGTSAPLALVAVSNTSPIATEGVSVRLDNWNPSGSTEVVMTVDGQQQPMAWRQAIGVSGTIVVIPPPKILDAQLNTAPYATSVEVKQGGSVVTFNLSVGDLPTLADFGTQPGQITKAVALAGLHLRARTLSTLQALVACTSCGNSSQVDLTPMRAAIDSRQTMLDNSQRWLSAINEIASGAYSATLTLPGVKPTDPPREALLTRDSVILADRILGLALMRAFEAQSETVAKNVQARTSTVPVGSAGTYAAKASFADSFIKVATFVDQMLSQTINGADTGLNLVKAIAPENGNSGWMDAVKVVGGVLGGAALVATVAGAAVASPLALGAAAISYGVGVVAGGDLLANAYDYLTSDNQSVRAQAAGNMQQAKWDVLGGVLAAGSLSGAVKEVVANGPTNVTLREAMVTGLGQLMDMGNKVADAINATDSPTADSVVRLYGPPKELDTVQVTPTGTEVTMQGAPIEITIADPLLPSTPELGTFGPANGPSTVVLPPNWGDNRDLQLRVTQPETGVLLASTPLPKGSLTNGANVTAGAFCTFAGGYVGPFSGTQSGGANVSVITPGGQITGGGRTDAGSSFAIGGQLSPAGGFTASAVGGTSDGASFTGTLYSIGTEWVLQGTWRGGAGGSGVFRLTRACPAS
jgi:hypothetical protein